MLKSFFNSSIIHGNLIFWLGWVILPLMVEFIPSAYNFILLVIKKVKVSREEKELKFYPQITIMVPVYNSASTLGGCLKSINDSTYPNQYIDVLCVDNGSKDDSFQVFQKSQMEHTTLSMNWLRSAQGKSKALNMAIFNSQGKYIINIDSDGQLEKNALYNLIRKYEGHPEINCMTGAILIDPNLLEKTPKGHPFLKLFRKIEFLEYAQAFLAGRNFQNETDSIFTLSGAFSSFRKSTLLKTRMYNTETICEDTQLTFQVKENLNQKVSFCEDAIFMVDPIEGFDKYYTQRQRWQIGELEVARLFILKKMRNPFKILSDSATRLLMIDHTMAFPKLIWFGVLFILVSTNGMMYLVFEILLLMYIMSVITSYLFYIDIVLYLEDFDDIRRYYIKQAPYVALLPLYTLLAYFVRVCGILNSINRKSSWKTMTFSEECRKINSHVRKDFNFIFVIRDSLRKALEK